MIRIEDLTHPDAPAQSSPCGRWIPSLDLSHDIRFAGVVDRLRDAWAVWRCRATAVQWPQQRKEGA